MKKILSIVVIYVICSSIHAEGIGKITPLTGTPKIFRNVEIMVTQAEDIFVKDRISTGPGESGQVTMNDGSVIRMLENTEITFFNSFLKIKTGKSMFSMKKTSKGYRIFTPLLLVGIYGTELSVSVSTDGTTEVVLLEGSVKVDALKGKKGSCFLKPGEMVKCSPEGLGKVLPAARIEGNSFQDSPDVKNMTNLTTTGNLGCHISLSIRNTGGIPVGNSWKLNINGYSRLNSQELVFRGPDKAFLKNLEAGAYDMIVSVNGIEHSFSCEVRADEPAPAVNLEFKGIRFELKIPDIPASVISEEILKSVRIFVTSNQRRSQLKLAGEGFEETDPGYEVRLTKGKFIYIYFHDDPEIPEKIEFFYDGTAKTERKTITICPKPGDMALDVSF